ncbi:hypothetical protein NSND_60556 [Nitrospira sp. ND1]|nr:hypothetical protein NSND_60556 [Nitrospira sp. ND1]
MFVLYQDYRSVDREEGDGYPHLSVQGHTRLMMIGNRSVRLKALCRTLGSDLGVSPSDRET